MNWDAARFVSKHPRDAKLCGSTLREDYDFDPVLHQFTPPLLNHVRTQDYWPAIGERAGWGTAPLDQMD